MNEMQEIKGLIYEFGKFVLDPRERVLFADGEPVHLSNKVFDTLYLFIRNNGKLLTKDEMMASIWEESFVEERNLVKNVSRLRKILNTDSVQLIETLPRHGYRFRADVKQLDPGTDVLVHRRLRLKLTHTYQNDNEQETPNSERDSHEIHSIAVLQKSRSKRSLLALGALAVAVISLLGFFSWERATPAVRNEYGAIRLTDNPQEENHPAWTKDGRIRFLRFGSDKQIESVVMNSDGTSQIEVRDFENLKHGRWSPDETKVIFVKPNDKTALYLANADGSNEIPLPFFGGNLDWSSDSRTVVYQKGITVEDPDIFVYTLETGKRENVTNNPAFDADPSFSPDGKQIVFASLRDGNAEIYLMNSDGSDIRRLTNNPAWDCHPVFSPDGTTIAFSADRESENSDVYLMNVDGSGIRQLTDWKTNEGVEPGGWSPDGTQIAFTSDRNGNDDIFVISAEVFRPRLIVTDEKSSLQFPSYSPDGKEIAYQAEIEDKRGELRVFDVESKQNRVLLQTENTDPAPVFSPDGEWIAFQNRIESNTEICLIKSDGSGLTNLTRYAARDVNPAFSPDGKQIVFASNRDGNTGVYDLYVMNADGSGQRQIYSSKLGISISPKWSPDGKQIIFSNDKEEGATGNFEIFKIRLETNQAEQRLTFRPRHDSQPAVSPDGKQIVFSSNTDGNSEIYLMNADGTNLLRVTRNQAEDTTPQFSQDGKKIIFSSNRAGSYAIYEIDIS